MEYELSSNTTPPLVTEPETTVKEATNTSIEPETVSNITEPLVIETETKVNTPVNTETQTEIPVITQVKEKKPTASNLIARRTITANLKGHEVAQIENIVKYRIAKGASTSYDHFARQCIDFAINHGKLLQGYLKNIPPENLGLFDVPDTHDFKVFEEKGFFN